MRALSLRGLVRSIFPLGYSGLASGASMSNFSLIVLLLALMAIGYQLGMVRSRKVAAVNLQQKMHSRPHHYGMMVGLWAVIPAFFILILWTLLSPGNK